MRNESSWTPTKYVERGGRLRATTDTREVGVGSRLVADRVARAYDRAIPRHVTGRLLDMGCGKAPLYATYRPYASDVQCIDRSNGAHGATYLDRECDLTEPLPYPNASFDTIILSDVLEHLPEPLHCWREMSRLLKPGGKLLLNVPFFYRLHEVPFDFYRYTEFALRRFADLTGFEVLEMTRVGGAVEILADVTSKLLASAGAGVAARAVQSPAIWFAETRLGSRIARKTSDRLPLGYFMVAEKV